MGGKRSAKLLIRKKKTYQLHVDALEIADETKDNIKAMYEVNLS